MLKLMLRLLHWVPEARGKFAAAALCKVFESIFSCGLYVFAILILDALLARRMSMSDVVMYTAGMAVCHLLQGVCNYLFNRMVWPTTNDMVNRLRIMAGEHLRKLPMSYFSGKTTGHLHSLVADEMKCIQAFIYQGVPDVITTVVFAVLVPVVLLYVDWRLALVTVGVTLPTIPFYLQSRRVLSEDLRGRSDCLAAVSDAIVQYIQGIEVSKTFGISGSQFGSFEKKLRDLRDINKRAVFRGGLPLRTIWVILDMGICLIPAGAIYLMYGGTTSLAVFLLFLIMGLRIYEPFKGFFMAVAFLKLAEPAVEKLHQLFETPALSSPETGVEPKNYDIRFDNVSFSYGDRLVLDGISFEAPANTITALVGPSGSGKTTITRLLARFWDVNGGSISIGGHDIRDMSQDTLLSKISLVFQDVYLFNDTVFQNIAYGASGATQERIVAVAKAARCHDFIMKLPKGYDTMVGEGGATLSGGEKQRISIARAMLKDAPIILLDEATASIDPENEALIQQGINALVASKTLVIIAHRLSSITSANRILVLNRQGAIQESGTHEELLKQNDLYASLWKSRGGGSGWLLNAKK